MSQGGSNNAGGSPGSEIHTLSSEGGAATPPTAGDNYNFSGSIAGGSAANGAIQFITPGGPGAATNGQMDAKVLVDGTTITINGSNQLAVNSSALSYYSLTPYIVGPDVHSQYATIASAIAQAVSDGANSTSPAVIQIKPKSGGYTENLTLSDGIFLNGVAGGPSTILPTINGKISFSAAATASIANLQLTTNSDFCVAVTGSAASMLYLNNCNIIASNNTAISYTSSNSSSRLFINGCFGDISTTGIAFYSMSSPGFMTLSYCTITNSGLSTTASSNSAGSAIHHWCSISHSVSSTSTGIFISRSSRFTTLNINTTCITTSGTGATHHSYYDEMLSGTASTISVGAGTTFNLTCATLSSSNTNVLTGAGTMRHAFIAFMGSSSGQNVTTFTTLPSIN